MKANFSRKAFFGALCTAAATLSASATPLTVTLVNAGSPGVIAPSVTIDGTTINNVYIGPYTISVNGTTMSAMCIDFNIESYVGDTYSAYETTVGSSNLSNTYAPTEGKEYEEEAYLFSQIVNSSDTSAQRTAIQEAAWDIMAYGITGTNYTTVDKLSDNTYIDAALANYGKYANDGYAIISDATKNGEQEFIVDPPPSSVTPEPSSLVLMLAPALLSGAEAVRRRRLNTSLLS